MFTQSLDGAWQLAKSGTSDITNASVPGCVHLDLMHAGLIEDPFVKDNEYRGAWVHETDWTYSRTFDADPELLSADRIYLECDGLDTIGDVVLNGETLGHVDNMYIQHRFDVTGKLAERCNTLEVRFVSPVNFAKPHIEQDPLLSPGDSIPGSIYTRKAPSQWGWDWGPKIPTTGIWRSIRLAGYDSARIEDLWVRQRHSPDGKVTLSIDVSLERFDSSAASVRVELTHPGGKLDQFEATGDNGRYTCSIEIADAKLWWPNGYGDQPLYQVEAVVVCGGTEVHALSHTIGLRTIKLEREKDQWGESFTFVVNGVKVFCKGGDWIPADQFPSRITDERYRHLISSCALANMNMLRIWGGGYYEDERFYDLCDEYGILVWQDFMFSCGQYPVLDWYLDNVRKDAEYNVIRLRNRACLALWCGNNEQEWFLAGGWGGELNARYREEYLKIYHELLPSVVGEHDPDTAYWPASPHSVEVFVDPNGQESGDGHYWEVWHGRKPFTDYRTQFHRFMSEFGFESMPALETIKSFAGEDDLNMTSYIMECHQKNSAGNGLILYYMAQTFRFPRDFEMMCYTSQLLQAEAMRYGIEHWRRNRGRCMGTLYWQVNDCWPVSSWASLDYFGRWKALQYFARRFYSPILLSVMEEGKRAEIHVSNDTTSPAEVELKWSLETLAGKPIRQDDIKRTIEGECNVLLADLDFSSELAGDTLRQAVLVCEFAVDGKPAGFTMTPFAPSKHLELPDAKITTEVRSDADGRFVEVSSEVAARYVCLSVPGHDVLFSDNYFDLPAGRTAIVRIESDVDLAELRAITAYSLRDSY